MLIRRRVNGAAVVAVCALILGSCGGSTSGALETLAPTQATDFVVVAVSTTTLPPTTTIPFTATPASIPASGTIPPSTTVAAGGVGSYTIAKGDSLASIASKFGMTIDSLLTLNGWTDGLDHLLLPGTAIKVNGGSTAPTTAGNTGNATTSTTAAGSGTGCTYTIQKGDNPSSVARKYGITVDELRTANPGGVMTTFLVGAVLKIPANGNC